MKTNVDRVQDLVDKYRNGYDKIIATESAVGKMQEELVELAPLIKKAAEETAEALEIVAV